MKIIIRARLLLRFVRLGWTMKRLHMPSHAERVIATKVAQIAAKFQHACIVNVSHVSLHVRLVSALVLAEGAGELRISRIHLTTELHVPSQQILQWEHLLAETAHVSLVTIQHGLRSRGYLKFIEFWRELKTIDGAVISNITLHVPYPWNRAKRTSMKRNSRWK